MRTMQMNRWADYPVSLRECIERRDIVSVLIDRALPDKRRLWFRLWPGRVAIYEGLLQLDTSVP
jgi:hypothetical protein